MPRALILTEAPASPEPLRLGLLAQNLTNARYPLTELYYASNFNSRSEPTLVPTEHFSAAPPFSLLATVSLLFDGGNER